MASKTGKELLSNLVLRQSKPQSKRTTLRDGGGLFHIIEPSGKRWWKMRIYIKKKENSFSLGDYPTISLAEAREQAQVIRNQKARGIDPGQARKAKKINLVDNSFAQIAYEWHGKKSAVEWSEVHSKNIISRLKKNIFPWLGSRPIDEITAPELIDVLRKIESKGHLETLLRCLSNCGQIFRYAIATQRATIDPTYKLTEAFPKPSKKHFSTITDPVQVGELMRSIDRYHGNIVVKSALQLAPLFLLRPKELRLTKWEEIDLNKEQLIIPIARMKRTRKDKEANPKEVHIVPLCSQALAILAELKPLTGNSPLVFKSLAGSKDRPISDATLTKALRTMGYGSEEMHVHGFRAMGRTMIRQELKFNSEIIERQLGHAVQGPLGSAYDRTTFLPERIEMMQAWPDYLDKIKAGAVILPFVARG